MIYLHLDKLFTADPLMTRTFAAVFSPAHLEHFALRLPLEVTLANLYFHLKSLAKNPEDAFKV